MTTVVLVIVSHVVDVKPQHHRVVFVNRVVTVHRVAPGKVAEAEVNLHVVILAESDDVLAASLDQRRRVPVALENLVLLEVNVDWVRPIKSAFSFQISAVLRFTLNRTSLQSKSSSLITH